MSLTRHNFSRDEDSPDPQSVRLAWTASLGGKVFAAAASFAITHIEGPFMVYGRDDKTPLPCHVCYRVNWKFFKSEFPPKGEPGEQKSCDIIYALCLPLKELQRENLEIKIVVSPEVFSEDQRIVRYFQITGRKVEEPVVSDGRLSSGAAAAAEDAEEEELRIRDAYIRRATTKVVAADPEEEKMLTLKVAP